MTTAAIRPDPAKIIVPRKHAQILIEPPLSVLEDAVKSPAALRDEYAARSFAGRPLDLLRRSAREHFLTAATQWARQTAAPAPDISALEKPWILTGHQVEFYHAGVWAKVIAADALAKKTGGVAFDILVDHDTIEHRGFDVPVQTGPLWKRTLVHWAQPSDLPADSLPAPTPEQFESWDAELAKHPQSRTDSLAFLMAALKIQNSELLSYVPWLSQARAQFERAMGLNIHHLPTSLVCTADTWQIFVQAWIENADTWTAAYNTHLAAYRKRQGIKNDHHPMPDLARSAAGEVATFELPFWIYKIGEARQRLFIKKSAGATAMIYNGAELPLTSTFRILNSKFNIRPRALTLTMYLRLFLADLFIHGIGGALYDQITGALLEDLFQISPPYACVSAAWLLPLGQPLEGVDDISHLKSLRHHIEHNPQRALDPFTALKTDFAELILARGTLIEEITNSLKTARNDKGAIAQRREKFRRLHELNAEFHAKAPHLLAKLDHQIDDARRAREQNKVLLHREYFFGLHAMDSLRQLIDKIEHA